ncbi:MAG: hypothetical protein JWP56_368, partial [Aeromicrobium sp.]|nr:hypothetical protein [Aeromicrobium sp.]
MNVVPTTAAVRARRSHAAKPPKAIAGAPPEENMAAVRRVLKRMCNDALPYGPDACIKAKHARNTVIHAVESGATFA